MELNFKVSDNQKFNAIWCLLNDKYNEENGYIITYGIQEIYDDYALVFNYEENRYERVTYTKDNEADMVSIGERTPVFFIDVTAEEKGTIERLRALAGSYELIEEKYNAADDAIKQNSEYSTKISELEENITTLITDKENAASAYSALETELITANENYTNAQATISSLTEENESLKTYKLASEKAKKQEVIDSYANLLPASVIDEFTKKIDEYTDELALDKELAYELKNSNLSIFTKTPKLIPSLDEEDNGGLAELLSKYKK